MQRPYTERSVQLYLQEEEFLCDLLDEFLRNIFWEELCPELKLQRILLLHVLLGHLRRKGKKTPQKYLNLK